MMDAHTQVVPEALQRRAWDVLMGYRSGTATALKLAEDAKLTRGGALAVLTMWHRYGYLERIGSEKPYRQVFRVMDFVRRTETFLLRDASSKPVSEHETRREEHAPPAR